MLEHTLVQTRGRNYWYKPCQIIQQMSQITEFTTPIQQRSPSLLGLELSTLPGYPCDTERVRRQLAELVLLVWARR